MNVPDRLRLPLHFDATPLAGDVEGLRGLEWIKHFVPDNYEGDWSIIPLRGKAGATHPVMMVYSDPLCHDFSDTPFLAACPHISAALAQFGCPLEAVRLMRLGPLSVIKEHRDFDLNFDMGTVRIHIPIITSPQTIFMLNHSRVVMEAGSAWYLRLSDPHSVVNQGQNARVHLVIDAIVNPWLEALMRAAMAEAA